MIIDPKSNKRKGQNMAKTLAQIFKETGSTICLVRKVCKTNGHIPCNEVVTMGAAAGAFFRHNPCSRRPQRILDTKSWSLISYLAEDEES